MKSVLPFLRKTLNDASKIANSKFGKVTGSIKPGDDNQVVTDADLAIGKFVIRQIRRAFPKDSIIDEEAGTIDNNSEYTWVIDPIDGTSNFAQSVPEYGIMVGLLNNEVPIAGGIMLPYFKELYLAEKGAGAFCNGARLSVTKEKKLSNTLVSYQIDGRREDPEYTESECSTMARIILSIRNLRTSGSTAYELTKVAKGNYGAALNRTSKIWDNVAPHILIEEAGGVYTDFFGGKMDYTDPISKVNRNFTSCAAPKTLHKQLQDIIQKGKTRVKQY